MIGLVLSLLAVGGSWALSSPPGSSADDDFHLASIWCAWGEERDLCAVPASGTVALVPADVARAPCFAYDPSVSGACSYTLGRELVDARSNLDGSYPGLFYAAMRPFVQDSVAQSVLVMRMVNVALGAAMLAAALVLAAPVLRRAVALAWLASMVPLTMFFLPSTNPSSWLIIGLGTYWAFLLTYVRGGPGRSTWAAGALAAVSATMAAGARADGAAFVGVSTAAVLIVAVPGLRGLFRPRLLLPAAIVVGAAVVYLSTGQSDALAGLGGPEPPPGREGLGLLVANAYAYPTLLLGVFGIGWGLGWLDTMLPGTVGALAASVAFFLLVQSSGTYWWRKRLAVLLVLLTLVVLPLYVLQSGRNLVGENVQPRYLLPMVIVALGLALLTRPGQDCFRLRAPVLIILVAAATVANGVALQANLRRYVTGVDLPGLDLDAGREWWWELPVGPTAVWAFGCLAGVALFASLASSARLPPEVPARTTATDVDDGVRRA